MRTRLFFLLGIFFLCAPLAFAQPKGKPKKPTKKMIFQGTIEQKPWAKSTQSYCAQGSEYFVLVQKDGEEHVLRNDSKQDIAAFVGKQVKITGEIETKTIKPTNNPMAQRPVGFDGDDSFTCVILVVSKIE